MDLTSNVSICGKVVDDEIHSEQHVDYLVRHRLNL